MAIIDDGFAYLYPRAAQAFSKKVATLTILPPSEASAALYAALDAGQAHTIYLSPLLASEVSTILSRNDSTRVAYMGTATLRANPRLYAAVFSSKDATELAAKFLAAHKDSKTDPEKARIAALFSGSEADQLAETFMKAYLQAGGLGELILRTTPEGYSQKLAEELISLDISSGYVSSTPTDTQRWLTQGFDPYAFVIVENALPDSGGPTMAAGAIAWNVEATIASLDQKLSANLAGQIPGTWKMIEFEKKRGVKRQ